MSISFNTYRVTLFILQFFGDPEEQQHTMKTVDPNPCGRPAAP